jgi:hypothetical protein
VSDPQDPQDPGATGDAGDAGGAGEDRPSGEEIGSVGEEAAKLLGALSDWAKDSSGGLGSGLGAGLGSGLGAGLGESLSGLADHAAATMSELNDHIATGAPECTYCPVCRTVHVVRQTSPEVKAHLASAASSFLQAVVGMLATLPPPGSGAGGQAGQPGGVERIDLDEDETP